MKKLLLAGMIFFICNPVQAELIRVWIFPDKSVGLTICSPAVSREKCIADALKSEPELQGLEYEDIEREEMPDMKFGCKDRKVWQKEKGKPFVINKVKEEALKNERLIDKRIRKNKKDSEYQKAIDELKAENVLPNDY